METKGFTQKDFMIGYMRERLVSLGIDIEKDDYYLNPKFLDLKKEYITEPKHFVTAAWWIEKNIVGQDRLLKIFGKYMFGIETKLSDKELKDGEMYAALIDKYSESLWTKEDIRKYFNRNEQSEKNGDKKGLVARLKEWGFDIDAFEENKRERVKLLYFLFIMEHDNSMILTEMLSNPTLENVDNGCVGDLTKNGSIMAEIKRTISREINPEYIYMLNGTVVTIGQEWETQIQRIMYALDDCDSKEKLDDLRRMKEYTDVILEMVCRYPEKCGKYEDSLLETFFLKMCEHEALGREYDILDISEIAIDVPHASLEYNHDRYIQLSGEVISREQINAYVKANRKELAQLVFEKDKISGSDYQKFDTASEKVKNCLELFDENTATAGCMVSKLLIVIIIQEIVRMNKNEKVENKFYRYDRNDRKTLNTELLNGNSAFRKNQLAWVAKVMRRLNLYKGKREETILARSIEKNIDRLMLKIYSTNSLNDMISIHNYIMIWLDAVFVDWSLVIKSFNDFGKEIYETYGLYVSISTFKAQMFFGTTVNSEIPHLLCNSLANDIKEMVESKQGDMVFRHPIGLEDNYFHEEEEFYIDILISLFNKEVEIRGFDATPNGIYRDRLLANGIPI